MGGEHGAGVGRGVAPLILVNVASKGVTGWLGASSAPGVECERGGRGAQVPHPRGVQRIVK